MANEALLGGLLTLVCLAVSVWAVGPSVAIFLLRAQRNDLDVLPETHTSPLLEDPDEQQRYEDLLRLGFQPAGSTWVHARFPTPLQWTWRPHRPWRWFASADGRTFVALFRLVRGEPIRVSALTLFADGGSFTTAYPGIGQRKATGLHTRIELQGVTVTELVGRHEQEVARIALERGAGPRQATLADIAAFIDGLFDWPTEQAGYAVLPLGFFGVPVALVWPAFLYGDRARIGNALPILALGLIYAALRSAYLRMFDRRILRTHTRAFQLEQDGAPAPPTTS